MPSAAAKAASSPRSCAVRASRAAPASPRIASRTAGQNLPDTAPARACAAACRQRAGSADTARPPRAANSKMSTTASTSPRTPSPPHESGSAQSDARTLGTLLLVAQGGNLQGLEGTAEAIASSGTKRKRFAPAAVRNRLVWRRCRFSAARRASQRSRRLDHLQVGRSGRRRQALSRPGGYPDPVPARGLVGVSLLARRRRSGRTPVLSSCAEGRSRLRPPCRFCSSPDPGSSISRRTRTSDPAREGGKSSREPFGRER